MIRYALLVGLLVVTSADSCEQPDPTPTRSASGVQQARASVQVQSNGLTIEQQNVRDRLAMDNKPGAIKHLYVISAFSGQVLLYSTVRGKVTSSGKRLTPTTVAAFGSPAHQANGFDVGIGGHSYETTEVLQDDGTYGSSIEYLYWWDAKGVYHQHYVSGGQIVHISDQPLRVAKVLINLSPASQ